MTTKQRTILDAARANGGEITLRQAVELVGDQFYNQKRHTGVILANMVKQGMLERIKPGLFRVVTDRGTEGELFEL